MSDKPNETKDFESEQVAYDAISDCLRDWFSISRDSARTLCATNSPENYPAHHKPWEDVTPAEAVQAIQTVIDGKRGKDIWAHIEVQS